MTKKELVTVVTEHRLMADTIAQAIGATEKHDGFYLGNGYAVTWTNGEVIEANFKSDEPFILSTNQDMRQMYAHHFSFQMRNYDKLVGYAKSDEDAAQLHVITTLWGMSKEVVNAMYPTIEGELTFLNLYWYLRMPVKVRRAWLPRLRKTAIVKAVRYGAKDVAKYEKWLSESLVNHFLKVEAESKGEDTSLKFIVPEDVAAGDDFTIGNNANKANVKVVSELPLHNMLTLWIAATAELGYEFEETFQIAHRLYAKKLISYPSLLQNGVPESVYREMEQNMRVLEHNSQWGHLAKGVSRLSRRTVFCNGETAYNGHGIVTTGIHPTDLTREEEKLYNLIVKRVIEAFTTTADEITSSKKKWKGGKRKFSKKFGKKAG